MKADQIRRIIKFILGRGLYRRFVQSYRYLSLYSILKQYFFVQFDIVFYCEQPSHWQNIKPVVDLLVIRHSKMKVLLITSYGHEDYLDARYPKGLDVNHNIPVDVLGWLNTRILYTPYTGLSSSQKPKNSTIIHTLVSLTSLDGVYPSGSFDNYDYILCAGEHHISDFRRWALSNRKLFGKILVPSGYPKLDLMLKEVNVLAELSNEYITVVYAPTHVYSVNEKLASLRKHGEEIINQLLSAGFKVIFRPHPVSFKDADKVLVDRIIEKYSSDPNLTVDRSKNYMETYAKANLMVTDLSGTGFTFSLCFLRPAIFFAPDKDAEAGLQGIQFDDRHKIGGVARSTAELIRMVNDANKNDMTKDIMSYRNNHIFNVGVSAEYIVETLLNIASDNKQADWVKL